MYSMNGAQAMSGLAAGRPIASDPFEELNALMAELESLPMESPRRGLIQDRIDQLQQQMPQTASSAVSALRPHPPGMYTNSPTPLPKGDPGPWGKVPNVVSGFNPEQAALAALKKVR